MAYSGNQPGDPNLGDESARDLNALTEHIAQWWGEGTVFHEIVSDFVHVDLHISPATADRPYHVVVTTGMSDRPMVSPDGQEFYCELLLALPPDWPLDQESWGDERFWWPFRQLKQTARFPHENETLLWHGHTLAGAEPPEPLHESVNFCGAIIGLPALCPQEAIILTVRPDKEVYFFALYPLYRSELEFARADSDAFFDKLEAADVTELIALNRPAIV